MARLLFSSPNNESTTTFPCFIPNCAHDDPFLPLPPPPSPLDHEPDSSSIPINVQYSNRLLPNFLIAAASLLALSFLILILFYSLLLLRRRRRRLHRSLAIHPPPFPPPQDPDLFDEVDVTHHVWFIRTVGLNESIVKAIPTMVYKSLGNTGDCSVCLGEFRDGEIVKLLPKCAHSFHVDCIDTWLSSHVNCPLCRAAVVVDLVGVSESARIEIGEEDQESSLDTVGLRNLTTGSSSSSSSLSREEVEIGHENENGNVNENDMQPIRRSVSMDASALGMIMLRAELDLAEGGLGNGKREIELKGVGICKSKEVKGDDDNLGKLGSDLKRSMTSRSERFFFPRYGRGRTASVLPL